jgi:hypothetical protein
VFGNATLKPRARRRICQTQRGAESLSQRACNEQIEAQTGFRAHMACFSKRFEHACPVFDRDAWAAVRDADNQLAVRAFGFELDSLPMRLCLMALLTRVPKMWSIAARSSGSFASTLVTSSWKARGSARNSCLRLHSSSTCLTSVSFKSAKPPDWARAALHIASTNRARRLALSSIISSARSGPARSGLEDNNRAWMRVGLSGVRISCEAFCKNRVLCWSLPRSRYTAACSRRAFSCNNAMVSLRCCPVADSNRVSIATSPTRACNCRRIALSEPNNGTVPATSPVRGAGDDLRCPSS